VTTEANFYADISKSLVDVDFNSFKFPNLQAEPVGQILSQNLQELKIYETMTEAMVQTNLMNWFDFLDLEWPLCIADTSNNPFLKDKKPDISCFRTTVLETASNSKTHLAGLPVSFVGHLTEKKDKLLLNGGCVSDSQFQVKWFI
jgi:hypothetical protein